MYQKIEFKNKVRLIAVPSADTQAVTVLVLVRAGSRYETRANNGVSHFVEHMMFKGTKARPHTLALAKELDGVGAEFNAFTGKDYTGYYVKANAKHLPLAVGILSDMLLNSKFDGKEIDREKGVILEEINMYEDNPLMYVEDLLEEIMYQGNPLGYLIAGSRETVRSFNRDVLVGYYQKLYRGKNIVITVAGNFDQQAIKDIEKKFGFKAKVKLNSFRKIKITQNQPRVAVKYKETEQTQLALGFPAYCYSNPKLHALQLLSVILGGNMSSRLFLRVRERQGLAYYIRSSSHSYEDTGALVIQAGLDKLRIDQAIKLILNELSKIKKGVSQSELKRAKEYLAGKTILDLEDSSHVAQWYSQQELLTDKLLTPDQKIRKLMAVKAEQVALAAKEVINFKRLNLAVIGPFKDKNKFYQLIK